MPLLLPKSKWTFSYSQFINCTIFYESFIATYYYVACKKIVFWVKSAQSVGCYVHKSLTIFFIIFFEIFFTLS